MTEDQLAAATQRLFETFGGVVAAPDDPGAAEAADAALAAVEGLLAGRTSADRPADPPR